MDTSTVQVTNARKNVTQMSTNVKMDTVSATTQFVTAEWNVQMAVMKSTVTQHVLDSSVMMANVLETKLSAITSWIVMMAVMKKIASTFVRKMNTNVQRAHTVSQLIIFVMVCQIASLVKMNLTAQFAQQTRPIVTSHLVSQETMNVMAIAIVMIAQMKFAQHQS